MKFGRGLKEENPAYTILKSGRRQAWNYRLCMEETGKMANIVDYLNWRGDLTFSQSPVNEVDCLILANLSYVPLDSIVPSPWEAEGISLRQASDRFWRNQEEQTLLKRFSLIKMAPFAMRRMAATRRFGELELMYYQNSVNKEEESQFSALCIRLGENQHYIAFRGTDDTLIGWKENFRMSFETVPAQEKAVNYLNYIGNKCRGELWLGGHSKGGNLAVYGGAKARPEIRSRIQGIYNFDGPGFSKTMLRSSGYQCISGRIHKYVPTASVVGMLLEHDDNYRVVSSEEHGLRQHDPVSWRVLGNGFVFVPKQETDSRLVNQTMHDWIYSLSLEERETLVNMLFQVMEDSDIHTLDDLGENRWRVKLRQMRRQIQKNPDYRQIARDAGQQMMEKVGGLFLGTQGFRERKKRQGK